jgi:hypothetical protein
MFGDTEITYVCSLGLHCHSSQLLKRNKYKLDSYPFDWVFTTCDVIIECIEDDFKTFLDKSYYINLGSRCGHSKYCKIMFNHHNPLAHIHHYDYFVRCVNRFRTLLQKPEHKLFVMTGNNNVDKIIEFNTKFSKYTSNYTLLAILVKPNQKQHSHTFTYNANIHFLEVHVLSYDGGAIFMNESDNAYLDSILRSSYTINSKKL